MGDFSTKTWEDTLAGQTRRERSKTTLGNSRKTSKKEKKKNGGISWKGSKSWYSSLEGEKEEQGGNNFKVSTQIWVHGS
jgi:hypothetical protein